MVMIRKMIRVIVNNKDIGIDYGNGDDSYGDNTDDCNDKYLLINN